MTTGLITRYNKPFKVFLNDKFQFETHCPEYHIRTEWRHENSQGYIRYDLLLEVRAYTRDYYPKNEVTNV